MPEAPAQPPATTQAVLDKAKEVGALLARHEAVRKLDAATAALESDVEARRAANDLARLADELAQREAQGQPATEQDRAKLTQAQAAVARSAALRGFQVAQMDYLDLLRSIDRQIAGDGPGAANPRG
ncbi:MAG: YlbF family regulator [Planctomycetota bacterium]